MPTIAKFEIEYVRCMDEDGNLHTALPEFAENKDTLLELYRSMNLIRVFDAKTVSLQRTGKMGTFPSSLGQEAVSIAVGHAMNKDDILCPYYRDQGAMYLRGIDLSEILAFWGGDERGSHYRHNREDFPIAIPISTQMLHATGVAYAVQFRKENRAVVSCCGDGGTSKSDFAEAVNAAGTWNLPIVLVVNNNQWAISVPRKVQSQAQTLAQKALAGGFEGIQVDGNDAIAVRDVMAKALHKARTGGGPTLIEAITYRLCDHTTADDAGRYVGQDELDEAWKHEPISRFRQYLLKNGHLTEEEDNKILLSCSEEVEEAVKIYFETSPQPPASMFDFLYDKLPTTLNDQRSEVKGLTAE